MSNIVLSTDRFIVKLLYWNFLPFSQCRERGTTYKAKLQVTLQWKLDNQLQGNVTKVIGNIPIMVKVLFEQLWDMIFSSIFATNTKGVHI